MNKSDYELLWHVNEFDSETVSGTLERSTCRQHGKSVPFTWPLSLPFMLRRSMTVFFKRHA